MNFLEQQNVKNYRLNNREYINFMLTNYIDFVYSFITFQHFSSFSEAVFYLEQIKRMLKLDGYAHIFFGKCWTKEKIKQENPTEIHKNKINLFIEPSVFYQLVEDLGFKIIETENTMRRDLDKPLSLRNESNQARVLFCKENE